MRELFFTFFLLLQRFNKKKPKTDSWLFLELQNKSHSWSWYWVQDNRQMEPLIGPKWLLHILGLKWAGSVIYYPIRKRWAVTQNPKAVFPVQHTGFVSTLGPTWVLWAGSAREFPSSVKRAVMAAIGAALWVTNGRTNVLECLRREQVTGNEHDAFKAEFLYYLYKSINTSSFQHYISKVCWFNSFKPTF